MNFRISDSIGFIYTLKKWGNKLYTIGIWKSDFCWGIRGSDHHPQTFNEPTNFAVITRFWETNCKYVFRMSDPIMLNHILKESERNLKTSGIWKFGSYWAFWDSDLHQPSLDKLFFGDQTTKFEVIWKMNFRNPDSILLNHILKEWETKLKTIGIWKFGSWWGFWDSILHPTLHWNTHFWCLCA